MVKRTNLNKILGYGKSFGSFGEICQGRLKNKNDFLITLPIDLWSTCEILRSKINNESKVETNLKKSKKNG